MICRKTMEICQTAGMCAPHGGCQPERAAPHQAIGWQCPVCHKGNAPFQKLCANPSCGVTISGPAFSGATLGPTTLAAIERTLGDKPA
jgi:hypothetical protein